MKKKCGKNNLLTIKDDIVVEICYVNTDVDVGTFKCVV